MFVYPSFLLSEIMDNSFNITKTSKTIFYYLVIPFDENDCLEFENTITASLTVFVF